MRLPNILNRENFLETSLLLAFCLCALFQCINVKIVIVFQIFIYLLFIIYICKKPREVFERFQKFKIFFLLYLLFCFFELLPVFASSDILMGLKIWLRTYVMRGTLFLTLLLSFGNWKPYSLVFFSLVCSYGIDSAACLLFEPPSQYGGRVTGFFGHPMVYAGLSCIALPYFFYQALNQKILLKKVAFIAFFITCLAVLLLNGTRGAWLAVGATIFIMLVFSKLSIKSLAILLVAVGCLGITSLYTSKEVSNRISTLTNTDVYLKSERMLLWKSSFRMFKDHPLLGVGLGDYTYQYQNKYIDSQAKEKDLTRAHSNIFQLLGESGLSGLTGYLFLIFTILLISLKSFIKSKEGLYLVVFSSTLCLFFQGFSEYNLGHSAVMKFYWLWLGALFPLSFYLSRKNENRNCLQ